MIKINMGCGPRNFGKDWYHVDVNRHAHVNSTDIQLYDFATGSIDLIYASHFLEYFHRLEAEDLLDSWINRLKPGGTLRVAVPDFEAMMHLYVAGKYNLSTFLGDS